MNAMNGKQSRLRRKAAVAEIADRTALGMSIVFPGAHFLSTYSHNFTVT